MLDLLAICLHPPAMMNHSWDADASVFQYPPLDGGSGNPILVLQATFATVFNGLPISTNWIVSMWRLRRRTERRSTTQRTSSR